MIAPRCVGGSCGLKRKQQIGLAGAFAGLAALCLWFYAARTVLGGIALPPDRPADRLAFGVGWLLPLGLPLLVGVWAAARRGFMPDAIDGTRSPASHGLEINLRYNQNTVEQVILAAIALAGLSLALPGDRLYLVPAMAASFVVGRATFWIGYLISPMGRAFGMVVTIVPTICAFAWLAWRAFN